MSQTIIKATALFLVALFMLAAVHELLPGFCAPPDMNGRIVCPFCKLLYSILLITAFLLSRAVFLQIQSTRPSPPAIICWVFVLFSWSLRGPPLRTV